MNIDKDDALGGDLPAAGVAPKLSVVIPIKNEEGSIGDLVHEITEEFAQRDFPDYEIIAVDDGSSDQSAQILAELAGHLPRLRVVVIGRSVGQSGALWVGVREAQADWIGTLDGDGQNAPQDLWKLWEIGKRLASEGRMALVLGRRVHREDPLSRRLTSYILNQLAATCLRHDRLDRGCGIKVFEREHYLRLPAFDHMHRFMPALYGILGAEVLSVPVEHRPRRHGRSNYRNLHRFRESMFDIVGVLWLERRLLRFAMCGPGGRRPLKWSCASCDEAATG